MGDTQWPFIGHQQFGQVALRLLKQGAWPATAILQGPANIGKQTIAFWILQKSFCQEKNSPCGRCRACRMVTERQHPRLMILDGSEGAISIEQVRELQQQLSIRHTERRWVVILMAESLTEAAANSLLKVLEDPPRNVNFLLTSNQPGRIPATVRSRLSSFYLRPATADDVPASDRQLLLAVDGRVGIMEAWRKDPTALQIQQAYAEDFCRGIVHGQWVKATEAIPERLAVEVAVLRQLLYTHVGIRRPMPWNLSDDFLEQAHQHLSFEQLVSALLRYDQRQQYLITNVAPRNVYEDLHQSF